MNENIIKKGFVLAGLVNIVGIAVVTHGLQSDTLAIADPGAFSTLGILCIMLWGMAYIASAPYASTSVLIPVVFALEKLLYTVNWALWFTEHGSKVESIVQQDMLGGLFLGGYGINDGLFCLFFAFVAWRNWRSQP